MGRFVDRLRALALAWGAPGLFLVAFLDSSILPLPGITDILLIVMVTRHREAMLLYVATTILGSVAGCLMMHAIGKKGGEALVRKRFAGARIEKTMASLQRHGVTSRSGSSRSATANRPALTSPSTAWPSRCSSPASSVLVSPLIWCSAKRRL